MKTRRKELPGHPLLGNGNSVNLSFYLNRRYTHICKQILEYIFRLIKYSESWDAVLIKSVDYDNFAAVDNLTIIFYTKLTKIWSSVIMFQAITYITYWFTVANHSTNLAYARRPYSRFHWKVMAWSWCLWHGEHGTESIHKIFRLLQRTYCLMQPAMMRLQSMLKNNIIGENSVLP